MKKDATSFINERSAELTIVPRLIQDLQPFYPRITPIFYWASREGAIVSQSSFQYIKLRLLVLYARRPKVSSPAPSFIEIKLNQLLFDRAAFFDKHRIPVLAGFPFASKLEELHGETPCQWLEILANGSELIFRIPINIEDQQYSLQRFITTEQIVTLIDNSPVMSWNCVLKKICEFRKAKGARYHPLFGGGDHYKPVFLLIHC